MHSTHTFFLEWPIEHPGCAFYPGALGIPLQALLTLHGNSPAASQEPSLVAAWSRESQAKNEL